jgi:hypothetical protein
MEIYIRFVLFRYFRLSSKAENGIIPQLGKYTSSAEVSDFCRAKSLFSSRPKQHLKTWTSLTTILCQRSAVAPYTFLQVESRLLSDVFIWIFFTFLISQAKKQTVNFKQDVLLRTNAPTLPALSKNTVVNLKHLIQKLSADTQTDRQKNLTTLLRYELHKLQNVTQNGQRMAQYNLNYLYHRHI